jgi:arsenate reductase (thioredoxin)
MKSLKRWLMPPMLLAASVMQGCQSTAAHPAVEPAPVLMVCEHGSVKSVMAASLFNRRAAQWHLPFRALARGLTPDPAVPVPIAAALAREGVDVSAFVPVRVSDEDISQAARVIAISVAPQAVSRDPGVTIDAWSDVPAASEDYAAARAALERHVDALLAELQQSGER